MEAASLGILLIRAVPRRVCSVASYRQGTGNCTMVMFVSGT